MAKEHARQQPITLEPDNGQMDNGQMDNGQMSLNARNRHHTSANGVHKDDAHETYASERRNGKAHDHAHAHRALSDSESSQEHSRLKTTEKLKSGKSSADENMCSNSAGVLGAESIKSGGKVAGIEVFGGVIDVEGEELVISADKLNEYAGRDSKWRECMRVVVRFPGGEREKLCVYKGMHSCVCVCVCVCVCLYSKPAFVHTGLFLYDT
jgi:hypothetical protein